MDITPNPGLIARGRTAEIYEWQPGWVLKLFYEWVDLESVEYEARLSRLIHASGLPVPAVGEIVRLNDRLGLPYQKVEGISMWPTAFSKAPWKIFRYARQTAQLHAIIHNNSIEIEIPRQRQRLINKIQHAVALPARLRSKALAELADMPDGAGLCHGDFHPANILVNGENAVVIDWIDATLGNPLADVARTTILLLGAAACQVRSGLQKIGVYLFHYAYRRHYFRLRPGGEQEYIRWLPLVAAARLSENIPELERWLILHTGRGLRMR
jgi:aminoglycoside phosphotransferase (APT) family kinase protein